MANSSSRAIASRLIAPELGISSTVRRAPPSFEKSMLLHLRTRWSASIIVVSLSAKRARLVMTLSLSSTMSVHHPQPWQAGMRLGRQHHDVGVNPRVRWGHQRHESVVLHSLDHDLVDHTSPAPYRDHLTQELAAGAVDLLTPHLFRVYLCDEHDGHATSRTVNGESTIGRPGAARGGSRSPDTSGCFALRVTGLVLAARLPLVRPVVDHGDRSEGDRYNDDQRNDCAPVTGRSDSIAHPADWASCQGNHLSVTSSISTLRRVASTTSQQQLSR